MAKIVTTTITEQNVDVVNNKSDLLFTLFINPNNTSTYCTNRPLTITCNGITQNGSLTVAKGGSATLTFTFTNIYHETDGSKSVNWSWNCPTSTSGLGVLDYSGTYTMQTIPRKSSISLPYGLPYIGQSITVNINRASSNFTDSVMAWFQITPENGVTDFYPLLAVNKTSLSQVNLEFNNTVLRQILGGANKDKLSIPMFITCETFNGNTSVGSTQTATMNMNVQRINPVITAPAIIDINDVTKAFTGDNTKIIKYLSKPKITVNATAQQYADIKWYSIGVDGATYYVQEKQFDSGITNPQITVNAMDTRNWENPTVYNLPSLGKWIDYEKIILNGEYCERIEQTSSTIKCKLKGSFFNNTINGIANSLTVSYRYRKQGEDWQDNWINIDDVTISGNNFTVDIPALRTDCSDLDSWEFQFKANDILMTAPIITKQITLGLGVLELAKEFANFNVDLFVKDYPVLTVKKIEKVVI